MTLDALNELPAHEASAEFLRCCGSTKWAEAMTRGRPYVDREALLNTADRAWAKTSREDWLEAFSHHPKIGGKASSAWAKEEQKGTSGAADETLRALAQGNLDYEKRFGHIFLICATGKSAGEMLSALQARLKNPPDTEIRIAAGEQA
ncbi:MAG: 2-oxo-4-hydroxy-4-carboxy-5-ureidoimidazoline decarboxylase, partial [Bdellovibrionota bacterium]